MHRAGYVYGCVAIRGVVIHRVAVPAPGRMIVSWSAAPVLAGHPAVVSVVVSKVVVGGGAPHAEEPPPAGGGGSSADPRCSSSVLRRSPPGGVLPAGAREGIDGARPIGLEREAPRTDAGF